MSLDYRLMDVVGHLLVQRYLFCLDLYAGGLGKLEVPRRHG